MRIQIFKSEYTGELFENEEEYNTHIQKYKQLLETQESKRKILHNTRLSATSLEDFRQKVFDTVNELCKADNSSLTSLTFEDIKFGDVSNTHSAPIGFETNWHCVKDKPLSYKGWNGRISFEVSQKADENQTKDLVCNFPGLNLGSGNGHYIGDGYKYSYDMKLFIEDFPLLKEQYSRYLDLVDKKEEWQSTINTICNTVNKDDSVLINYENTLSEYDAKIKALTLDRDKLASLIAKRQSDTNRTILENKPFENHDELIYLTTQFKAPWWKN